MKKILGIIVVLLILAILGGIIFLKMKLDAIDQLNLQYDQAPETPHQLQLDTMYDKSEIKEELDWLLNADIQSIQTAIDNKEITVEELVKFYGLRVSELDSKYNSVIRLNPHAIEQAVFQDKKIKRGEPLQPLTGVIVLVKDNIAVEGMETTAGSYALKSLHTTRNADLIQMLMDKGAIILGKSNLSEFSNFMSFPSPNGFSTLGGQTYNPYGRFDVGGSSSGSAVAASMVFSTVTIGTETSGSLIHPAGQNSVVAIKPTLGLLSGDLIIPITKAQDTAGIMGRTVSDVYHVFGVSIDQDLKNEILPLNAHALKGKKVVIIDHSFEQMSLIKSDLEKLGAECVIVPFPEEANDINILPVLTSGMYYDLNDFLKNEDVKSPMKDLDEIIAYNDESEDRAPFGQYWLKQSQNVTLNQDEYQDLAESNAEKGLEIIEFLLEDYQADAIVSVSSMFSKVYAPAGCPAVTVPSGYMKSGEPYGVTFIGHLNDDLNLLQLAYSYEQATLYRKIPPQRK